MNWLEGLGFCFCFVFLLLFDLFCAKSVLKSGFFSWLMVFSVVDLFAPVESFLSLKKENKDLSYNIFSFNFFADVDND